MSESPEATDAEHRADRPDEPSRERPGERSGERPDDRPDEPSGERPGEPSGERPDEPGIIIAVMRSGGIAGISRRWRVEIAASDSSDAESWIALIERCPWNAETDAPAGADRFVWSIRARTPQERRERELPDTALAGPWRDLVDAVRAASA